MNDWMIAILPVLGVILGAALQFWFSRTAEREKHAATLQSQAYADYLRAVAAAGHLRSDEDLRDAHRDAADAKARIAVYGSASCYQCAFSIRADRGDSYRRTFVRSIRCSCLQHAIFSHFRSRP